LLDLKMKNVDGFTVLAEMKKDYAMRSIPVVMISAHSDVETQVRCIAHGADDYLVKPPHPALLGAQVRSCLSKGWLRKQERLLSDQVRASKQRADDLLYNIFPYTVARDLVTTGTFEPRCCDNVAVLFCDVVGFTSYCDSRPPKEVVANLNDLFSSYEDAIEQCGIEKIKTIGDCIMVTAGLMTHFENPVLSCLQCGKLMVAAARDSKAKWEVRVGIHVGPVVAGMAGRKHYLFDIWGDTVNTAARVQSTAEPGAINLSELAWAQVYKTCYGKSLGMKKLKGKTSMEVFQFEGFRGE
jgi:class 3 adenylate cyclase